MKQKRLLFALFFMAQICSAQSIHRGESALIYYMPKTTIRFQVNIEKTIETPGIFYLYAEKYLGATDIITTASEKHELKSVHMQTKTDADLSRAYTIPLSEKTNASYIINSKGLLCCINTSAKSKTSNTSKKQTASKCAPKPTTELMPLNEEQMRANSIGKMAEEVAQQIYRIRENRLTLLTGDMDPMPQDGMALKLMLQRLEQEEQRLCELFVGKRTITTYQKHIEHIPEEALTNHILFRFSSQRGMVAADDLSGEPIYLNLVPTKQDYAPDTKKSLKNQLETAIYYNLSGTATITILISQEELYKKHIPVAQFGIALPLPMPLFEKKGYKAIFDPKTGNLLELTL